MEEQIETLVKKLIQEAPREPDSERWRHYAKAKSEIANALRACGGKEFDEAMDAYMDGVGL